jgi:hypothetical protein
MRLRAMRAPSSSALLFAVHVKDRLAPILHDGTSMAPPRY